ncbi:MAG: hypothetical protein IPH49_10225 [Ignavibacteria bacterium]|nr:hypothetical protein [Ignavibacteria bacterium]
MRTPIVLLFGLLISSVAVQAQGGSIVPSLMLVQSGNANRATLLPPSGLTSPVNFTLPTVGGTLLVSSSTASPTFGGLTVSGGSISLDPGVGNDLTLLNIPADGATTIFLTLDGLGRLRTNTVSGSTSWSLSGNAITLGGTGGGQQYLGTSNAQDLVLGSGAIERMRITSAGNVSIPNVATPQGSRLSVSSNQTAALTQDAAMVNLNATYNNAAASFAARGIATTTILTNNSGGITPQGVYARTTVQNSSGTIADAAGVYADFSRTSGGGSLTLTRYTGLRTRFIANNASIQNGIGLFVDGPNNTGVLLPATGYTGILIDTIPASGTSTRRVFFYNAPPGEQVLITANGALALGTATPAASSRLEVAGTAGTPNVRLSSVGGVAKPILPVGFDRVLVANASGDIDNVSSASLVGATAWLLGGNTGITASNNIIGIAEANANPLRLFTNNTERMQIASDGRVGIGVAPIASYQLAIAGNQRFTNATSSTITSNQELILEQLGDTFGTSRLRIQHRDGSNGALFETQAGGGAPDLVDFGFKPGSGVQSNIRLEFRGSSLRNPANSANGEFQYLMASTTSPQYVFSIGRAAAAFENVNVGVGDATPDERFTVGTTSQFRVNAGGDLIRIKDVPYVWPAANGAGVLTNNGSGTLSWTPMPLPTGTTTNSTLRWNGTAWAENTTVLAEAGGNFSTAGDVTVQNAKEVRLVEAIADGTNFSAFKSSAQANDIIYTLPTTQPSNGQVLSASTVSGSGPYNVSLGWTNSTNNFTIVRNATTDATNSTTYQDLTELSVTVVANTSYTIDALLRTENSNGNHNMDIAVTFPSGTATYSIERADANGGETTVFDATSPAEIQNVDSDNNERVFRIQGVAYIGGTGGTLKLQFRRRTAGPEDVRILSGSYFSVGR